MKQNANNALLPAYLMVGEDALKRQTALKRLRTRVSQVGDVSFNADEFDGEHATGADIVASCNTLPFASPMRLVTVLNAEKLKKADAEALVSYLNTPLETTVLALSAEKLAKNTRLYKACAAVGKTAVIDCAPKKRYELPRLVKGMAKGYGVNLSDAGALALLDLLGENTVLLDNELKKIALSCIDVPVVTDVEVRTLVARVSEVKPWDFVDAFAARDVGECLRLWGNMQSRNPYALIAQCTERVRELIAAQCLDARGESRSLSSVLKVPDWRVKNHVPNARKWPRGSLEQALMGSVDTEYAMKSGTDPQTAFIDWVIASLR